MPFTDAAKRGVDVKIILPGITDSQLALYAQRYHYSELLKSGVKLYERRNALLHAKTAVIDKVWSTVGSTNMDFWSLLNNDEVNAVILSHEFADEMEKMFARDLAESDEIQLEEWEKDLYSQDQGVVCAFIYPLAVKERREIMSKSLCRSLSGVVPLILFTAIFCSEPFHAASGPQPPCGTATFPPYPGLEKSPVVRVWDRAELGRDWNRRPAPAGLIRASRRWW